MKKEKYIDLTNIPTIKEGTNKGKIDWSRSSGCKLPFVYGNVKGDIYIINYKDRRVTIKYNNDIFSNISTQSIKDCKIGKFIGEYGEHFKLNIGDTLKDKKRNLTILDKEYRIDSGNTRRKHYLYICNNCNVENWAEESNLLTGQKGCPRCSRNPTPYLGVNTIYDVAPWMMELGVSEEDAKTHTPQSNKKIEVVCPHCKNKKNITVSGIYKYKSIGCKHCGDSVTYPERIMINILSQLNIEFEIQYSEVWSMDRRYDFYFNLNNQKIIVETHGEQHYKQAKNFKRTLKEEQENDKLKKNLALINGIDKYIVIDCRYSDLKWIKNNILNSELPNLLDLSNINWLKCEKSSLPNLIKEICDYWNNKEEWETTQTIADNNSWGIKSKETIRNYLKKGTKLGWCEYNPKEEVVKSSKNNGKKNAKKVEIFKEGVSLGIFESCTSLSEQSEEIFGVKLLVKNISNVCKGRQSNHKGFTFKYATETEENNIKQNNQKESA